jgi:two-component system, cell cycle sensor histidine kinase and response regulator CckA
VNEHVRRATRARHTPAAGLRVLLVTPDPTVAAGVVAALRADGPADFAVVATPTVSGALGRLQSQRFDAVLLDLAVPDLAGPSAILSLHERWPELPIVAIGPDTEPAAGAEALKLGAQELLPRGSVSGPELGRSLRHAVWRAAAGHARVQRESVRQLQRITEGIPGAVYHYRLAPDGGESFRFMSAGIRKLAGIPSDEVEADARRFWSLVHPDDVARCSESLLQSARTLRPWLQEFRLTPKHGVFKWIRGSALPTPESDGGTLWNGIFVDVSEQRLLEEQLRQAQKMEAVGQLAGGVAHDFNNLLTAIGSSADMAMEELADPQALREHLGEIHRAAVRAADLTRQLLAFSRRQVLNLEAVALADVVREGERMLRRLIGEAIRLETSLDPEAPPVRADRSQLAQVVMNLAVNARDAMPLGGTLTLATGHRVVSAADARRERGLSPGAYSLLIVRDTGTGMDDATRSRIFEPFFTTKEQGKGTGLGLSMVYGIVKQTGGYVHVDTAPGRGTAFTIHLPVAAMPAGPPHRQPQRRRVRGRGTETVLVVEDEDGVRAPVRRILVAHGYRVLEASDGPSALHIAEVHAGKIDLLLTDVVMPGMNGGELARRLRGLRSGLRVVFMSGYSAEAVATHGVLSPGAAFLQKPFSVEELLERLREALEHAES